MLADKDPTATLPVKNLDEARAFYEGKLGLAPAPTVMGHVINYRCGSTTLLVYESKLAGTNQATAVTFSVGDQVDAIVKALRAKGATFEHYDMPGARREGDIHVFGEVRNAWLKDPSGNVISIVNG